VSRAPDLYVNETARDIAPVRMTGNYGGEVLRRVRAFKPLEPSSGLFAPELLSSARQAEDTYARLLRSDPLSFAVFRQAPWYQHGLLALEESQLSVRTPYLDNDLVRTVFRAPESAFADDDVCLRLIADADRPALRRIRTDRGVAGRGPLGWSTRALFEFQFRAEYAYDYGMPQWMVPIDRLLSPLHPERLFLGRHKFSHFRVWYRDVLADYLREVLLDPSTLARSYLVRKNVEAAVHDHLEGRRNYTTELHKLLTIELVHRLFLLSSLAR
jgi:asparagine synthase (glutamine-hydrolysing)